jgi:predicted aconitase with swiveling domain
MTATELELHGRGLGGGVCEGEALVTTEAVAGWGGIDQRTGTIIESEHELVGQSIAGKVLVFPAAKGSSGWSGVLHMTRLEGCAPKAMVFNVMNTKIALAVVVSHVPCVTALDQDPTAVIRTGDLVRVNGDRGVIEILKRKDENARGA